MTRFPIIPAISNLRIRAELNSIYCGSTKWRECIEIQKRSLNTYNIIRSSKNGSMQPKGKINKYVRKMLGIMLASTYKKVKIHAF